VDGDNDPLQFDLAASPGNMTIDSTSGKILWTPDAPGVYPVNVSVSDGNATSNQIFEIFVPGANRPPRITNTTLPDATVGVPYSFKVPAIDDDGDALTFILVNKTGNMALDSSTGVLNWTPEKSGTCSVSVKISDSETSIIYDFLITVRMASHNQLPMFTSKAVTASVLGLPYSYYAKASDQDDDVLSYTLITSPSGMAIDSLTGKIFWTPTTLGNFTVKIKASDGRGGEAFQEFTITVLNRTRPTIEFITPTEGQKVKTKITVSGIATKGTVDIVKIQLRVDSGEWIDMTGNSTWTYSLDTTKLQNGKHTLQARAFDGMDYSDIANRTMIVDNPKPAGKGFIPAFESGLALVGIFMALMTILRRRRSPFI